MGAAAAPRIYICGDGGGMFKGVHAALVRVPALIASSILKRIAIYMYMYTMLAPERPPGKQN